MDLSSYRFFSFTVSRKGKSRKHNVISKNYEAAFQSLGHTDGQAVYEISLDPTVAVIKLRLLAKKPKNKELVAFFKGVSRCIHSGVSIANAIKLIAGQTKNPLFKGILGHICLLTAQEGKSFSQALTSFPKVFSPMVVALVQAGEKTGNLEKVLLELGLRLEKADNVAKNLKSSLYYPAFILFITLVAFVVIIYFVIPQMQSNFEAFDVPLPAITQFYISLSTYMHSHWLFLPSVIMVIAIGGYFGRKFKNSSIYEKLILRLPVFGEVVHVAILSRCLMVLSMLLKSGCDVLTAYNITVQVSGNIVYQTYFAAILHRLKLGESPATAFDEEEDQIGPNGTLLANQAKLSTYSGDLDVLFNEIAIQLNEELETKTRELPKLIQPVLMLCISIAVGSLIAAIYLPTFSLLEGVVK